MNNKAFWILVISVLLSILAAFMNIYLIYLEKNLTDAILSYEKKLFSNILTIIVLILISKIFFEYAKAYFIGKFTERYMLNLRLKIGKKLSNTNNIEFIEKKTSGDFISNLTNDLSLIQNFVGGALGDILYQPFVFVLGFLLAIYINWKLTVFSLSVIPFLLFGAVNVSKPVEKITKRQQDVLGDVNKIAQDTFSGINIVKAFNIRNEFINLYMKELKKAFKESLKSAKFEALLDPVKGIMQISPFLLMFFYGGELVIRGEMSVGGIVAFIELMNIFLAPMNVLPNVLNSYRKAKGAMLRLKEIFRIEEEKLGVVKSENKDSLYAVEFEDVSFSYENRSEVLKDVNFKVKRGEKIAIVGESGSGKSTIVKLILGLYKPTNGNIKVLGENLNNWDLEVLRSKISIANQDIYLFPDSIRENIKYGRYDAKDEEIIEVSKKVYAYDFVISHFGSFEEEVGERGAKLSGGERQRLSLARCLLRNNAEIFIFDEATSALDNETELKIQKILEEELKDKTLILLTHRFSSIKMVDRIIVVDRGKIVEEGTHDELLEKKGIYFRLYSKQFEDKLVANEGGIK